jgi:hypothetical protein
METEIDTRTPYEQLLTALLPYKRYADVKRNEPIPFADFVPFTELQINENYDQSNITY